MEIDDSKYFANLDWGKLKGFYYVAKEHNISAAAGLLKLTPSGLSRQISSFEKDLGYPLFRRTTLGVFLTQKGKKLFKIVERMFLDIKEFAYNNHVKNNTKQKRKIRISTTHAIAAYMINDILSEYNDSHPHVVFELITHDKLIDIIVNDVDIAIRVYDSEVQGIKQELLFILEKKLYASSEYIKNYGVPKEVGDLKNHRIIAPAEPRDYPYSDVEWILKLGMPKGKLNKFCFSCNSIECLVKEAQKGKGIIGGYEAMSIIRNSSLENILRYVKGDKLEHYFMYPDYLSHDKEIISIKNYLKDRLNVYKIQ